MIIKDNDFPAKEYELFLKYSEAIGLDRTMVQAAGGNTSLKEGDTMWIKASGKWLVDARSSELMVPVSISKIKDALKDNNCSYDDILKSIDLKISPEGLRPSVEAPMHAALDFKFIFHTHDINVNALAVQKNSQMKFEEILSDLNWKFIPYVTPGVELSYKLMQIKSAKDNVFILENHGLIVCGNDLEEIRNLYQDVRDRLKNLHKKTFVKSYTKSSDKVVDLKKTVFKFCEDELINNLAFHQPWIDKLTNGVLLPDFLVFLGPKLLVLNPNEDDLIEKLNKISMAPLPFNSCVVLAGQGVIIRNDALRGTLEIIRCVHDLLCLIPENADLQYLNDNETSFLLNWEAEHYRQKQNKKIP
tara:strand:- start:383 stop:1459 length:1077 start_codon:yes stop_codon:yes gene_type:complete